MSSLSLLFRSGFAPLLMGMAVLEPFSFQFFSLYSSPRLSALGLSDAAIGYVTSGAFAFYLLSSIAALLFLDRLNVRIVLALCLVCAALSSAGFGLAQAAVPAVAAVCCFQLFYGWLHPAKNTRLSRFGTPETLSTFFSYSLSVQSFTCAGLGALGAALVGLVGMQPLITVGALCAAGGGAGTLAAPDRMKGAAARTVP